MLTVIDWIVVCAPFVLGAGGAWVSIRPPKHRYHWLIGIVLFLLGIAGAGATLYQIRQTRTDDQREKLKDGEDKKALREEVDGLKKQVGVLSDTSIPKLLGDVNGLKPPPKIPPPDIRARFVHPDEVAIEVYNTPHAGIADRPKYATILIDLDNLAAEFLRIPTFVGDYIRPGDAMGPNQFMGIDAVKSVVKPGDRIFGSVWVSCPTCVKSRAYWVFIKAGDGGWYSEQEGAPRGIQNMTMARQFALNVDANIDSVAPSAKRVAIK